MKITPLFDRVLVLPISEGHVSRGGLLIPDVAQNSRAFVYGDVMGIGFGRVNAEGTVVPLNVKVGDVVMFARKAGVVVPIPDGQGDETDYVLLREPEILGIVTDLPRDTGLVGQDGRLLAFSTTSRAAGELADSVFKNRDDLDRVEKDFGIDTSDHVDEPA